VVTVTGIRTGFASCGPVPQPVTVTGTQAGFTGYGPVPQLPAQRASPRLPAGQKPTPGRLP
jgi:hypothetical protein